MEEDDERGPGGIGLGRTLALSDGVFAIAMTLLALHGKDIHGLAGALGRLGDVYFVSFLSFTVIGVLWLAHHRLFSHAPEPTRP